MIIKHSHELKELYGLESTKVNPISGFNRRTGWEVKLTEAGYFYATNINFGHVEGCIDTFVSSNEQYVLTDFMKSAIFEPTLPVELNFAPIPIEEPIQESPISIEKELLQPPATPSLNEVDTGEEVLSVSVDTSLSVDSKSEETVVVEELSSKVTNVTSLQTSKSSKSLRR
jgi:hypothetical protein